MYVHTEGLGYFYLIYRAIKGDTSRHHHPLKGNNTYRRFLVYTSAFGSFSYWDCGIGNFLNTENILDIGKINL